MVIFIIRSIYALLHLIFTQTKILILNLEMLMVIFVSEIF